MTSSAEDKSLIVAAVDAAKAAEAGSPVPASVLSMLRAIASTRDEQTRHALANRAQFDVGEIGMVGLQVLRMIFLGVP